MWRTSRPRPCASMRLTIACAIAVDGDNPVLSAGQQEERASGAFDWDGGCLDGVQLFEVSRVAAHGTQAALGAIEAHAGHRRDERNGAPFQRPARPT